MSSKIFCVSVLLLANFLQIHGTFFKITDQVFFDISHGDKPFGRIVIGLFGEDAPKTVQNFLTIATTGIDGQTYEGTRFHRVIRKFMIQGGDIISGDGRGAISIYGKYFEDENLLIKHTGPGFVAMANKGPDTNGCQFYITTMAAPWLDGKHTIFGKVIEGQSIVHTSEMILTDVDDVPITPLIITASGKIDTLTPFEVSDEPYDLWAWIKASTVPLGMSFSILGFFHWMLRKLDIDSN